MSRPTTGPRTPGAPALTPNSEPKPRPNGPSAPVRPSTPADVGSPNGSRPTVVAPKPTIPTPNGSRPTNGRPAGSRPSVHRPTVELPEVRPPSVRTPDDVRKPGLGGGSDSKPGVRSPDDVRKPGLGGGSDSKPGVRTPDDVRKPGLGGGSDSKPGVRTPDDVRKPGLGGGGGTKPRPIGTEEPSKGNGGSGKNNGAVGGKGNTTASNGGRAVGGVRNDGRGPGFVDDEVHGVPVRPMPRPTPDSDAREGGGGRGRGGDTIIYNDNRTYNRYVTNINYSNGWWPRSHWSSCGPCDVWQPCSYGSGLSVSLGFGSGGFSFGFFYGSSCAPLCSSWCNPWWDGYATCWSAPCGYSYWRTTWCDPCRPWWNTYYSCGPCPVPAWTPCYTYAPVVYTPVVYQPVVYTPAPVVVTPAPVVVTPVPTLPNPSALWTFLAEGYDRDAEDGFAQLAAAEPGRSEWFVGQGFARAFRGETAWASDILREAFVRDPASIVRTSGDARFVARLDALERSLSPLASSPAPSVDALLVIAASQAARGDLSGAYFTATTAQGEGDRSAGTANFVAWLDRELRSRI